MSYKKHLSVLILVFTLALVALLMSGCAAASVLLNTEVTYKKDLELRIGEDEGEGILVVDKAETYRIYVSSKGEMDWVTVTSCHREMEYFDQGGWLGQNRMNFYYTPDPELESDRACPLTIGSYSKKDGQHGWGVIDFRDKKLKLTGHLTCNGKQIPVRGVGLCDSRVSLRQRIVFKEPVEVRVARSVCLGQLSEDKKKYLFNAQKVDCLLVFIGESGESLRLTSMGYSSLPPRP